MPRSARYWLFKTEPESFSIQDLAKAPRQTTCWDGVRNYQARNFLRDDIKEGDRVLFYHPRPTRRRSSARQSWSETVIQTTPPGKKRIIISTLSRRPRNRSGTWWISGSRKYSPAQPLDLLRTVPALEKWSFCGAGRGSRYSR